MIADNSTRFMRFQALKVRCGLLFSRYPEAWAGVDRTVSGRGFLSWVLSEDILPRRNTIPLITVS